VISHFIIIAIDKFLFWYLLFVLLKSVHTLLNKIVVKKYSDRIKILDYNTIAFNCTLFIQTEKTNSYLIFSF